MLFWDVYCQSSLVVVVVVLGHIYCDRTAQNSSVLLPKPVHVAIKQ
jgi:hypothetical protein